MWQKASTCNFLPGEGSIPSSLSWVLSLSNQEGLDHSLGCCSYSCLRRDQHVLAFKEQMPCLFLHHPEMSWLFIMEKKAIHAHYVSSHPHQFTSPLASVGFIFILKGFCEHLHSQFSSVQSLSCVWLFATPCTAAGQASLGSDQFSYSVVSNSNSLWPHSVQYARPPCPSPSPGVYSNSCPSSQWCHPTISSSVVPFSSRLQSSPASGSFPMSQFFTSGGQSIGVSASASVLPMNIQDWFPLW